MIRRARISDVKRIQDLINRFAKRDLMLPRSLNELYETVRDFFVYESSKKVHGCCALHICWEDLAEIKSLVVRQSHQGQGLGRKLVEVCLKEAKALGIRRIFLLTYIPQYFEPLGFMRVKRSQLPHKIWAECIRCVKFPNCDEVPMMKK